MLPPQAASDAGLARRAYSSGDVSPNSLLPPGAGNAAVGVAIPPYGGPAAGGGGACGGGGVHGGMPGSYPPPSTGMAGLGRPPLAPMDANRVLSFDNGRPPVTQTPANSLSMPAPPGAVSAAAGGGGGGMGNVGGDGGAGADVYGAAAALYGGLAGAGGAGTGAGAGAGYGVVEPQMLVTSDMVTGGRMQCVAACCLPPAACGMRLCTLYALCRVGRLQPLCSRLLPSFETRMHQLSGMILGYLYAQKSAKCNFRP